MSGEHANPYESPPPQRPVPTPVIPPVKPRYPLSRAAQRLCGIIYVPVLAYMMYQRFTDGDFMRWLDEKQVAVMGGYLSKKFSLFIGVFGALFIILLICHIFDFVTGRKKMMGEAKDSRC